MGILQGNIQTLRLTFAKKLITVDLLLLSSLANRKFIIEFWLIIERPSTTNLTTGGQDQPPPIPKPEVFPMPEPTDIRK